MKAITTLPLKQADTRQQKAAKPQVLEIINELSYEHANEVMDAVRQSLLTFPKEVVLDLSKVDAIDSSGVRALLQSRQVCKEAGVGLRLSGMSECATRAIQISGLGRFFGLPAIRLDNKPTRPRIRLGSTAWKTYEHIAASDPALISVLRERIADAAVDAGVDNETLCDIKIAAGEALTNAYRHGSPMKGVSKITVRCMTCAGAIVIEVEDEGQPFNPNATSKPDPRQLRDHGMGIYLMRQAMDIVEFNTGCPGNCVRMVKWLNGGRKEADEPLSAEQGVLPVMN